MRLGLDFDNTLISYDSLFYNLALEKGLIAPETPMQKNAVRDSLREKGIEESWTRLQGEVYGSRILEAEPYPSMLATLSRLTIKCIPMCIVSHKTKHPYLGDPHDLHAAAKGWLKKNGFFDIDGLGWSENQIFFEITKQEKISRILSLGCTHYVDDLPEILSMLPDSVQKILFTPSRDIQAQPNWRQISSWQELPSVLGL